MAWTDDNIDTLKRLWGEGRTAGEIAKEMGVSRNAILGKSHRLGLEERPNPVNARAAKSEQFERLVDYVGDFDVEIAVAARYVGIEPADAEILWSAMCAAGGRQYS